MNTAMVTTSPVIVASQDPEHPVVVHKNSLRGIGITGILIGLYAAGLGIYYISTTGGMEPVYNGYEYVVVQSYAWMYISAGIWFLISGSLAIAAGTCPNGCNIVGGIVIAILTSLAAFGLMIREASVVYGLTSFCQDVALITDCSPLIGLTVAHGGMAVLGFIEFVLAIVHASYSCSCCGKSYASSTRTAMTIQTTSVPVMRPTVAPYGKGYARLHNEYEGYPQAYTAPTKAQGQAYPPPYY